MKQIQYSPMSVAEMAVTLFTVNNGYFDDIEVARAQAFESALLSFLKSKHAAIMDGIESSKELSADNEKALVAAIEEFKTSGAY